MEQKTITVTRAEMKKAIVVEKILGGHMTNSEGAAALGITVRQLIRIKHTYRRKARKGWLIRTEDAHQVMPFRMMC